MRKRRSLDLHLRSIGKEQVAVAELEAVGLPLRIINLLEEKLGVIWLEELLVYTPEELTTRVPNLGEKSVALILDCVKRFDQIEAEKHHLAERFHVGKLPTLSADEADRP